MPKQKTHSAAKKRFRVTRTGKVMSRQKNRAHLLGHKSSRRKRRLAGMNEIAPPDARKIKKLLNQ
jgi:large subunit ribosomal protein L35